MSIRAQAVADVKANINADGVSITFTDADSNATTVVGNVWRVDESVDPETGAKIIDPMTAVSCALADLPSDPDETWTVSTTDSTGATVSGRVMIPLFDRTMNLFRCIIERDE